MTDFFDSLSPHEENPHEGYFRGKIVNSSCGSGKEHGTMKKQDHFGFTWKISAGKSKVILLGGVNDMTCPFCKEEMRVGRISQDRYALKWVPDEQDKGLLNFTPLVKGIKLTSIDTGMTVKVFHCEACRKFIIDQDDLR